MPLLNMLNIYLLVHKYSCGVILTFTKDRQHRVEAFSLCDSGAKLVLLDLLC